MSSLVDLALDSVPDLKPVPAGEYSLWIKSAKYREGKEKGTPMIAIVFGIADEEDADDVFHNIILPTEDDDQRKQNTKRRMIKTFCDCFSINYDTLSECVRTENYEALENETGRVVLDQEEFEGVVRNKVVKFITK